MKENEVALFHEHEKQDIKEYLLKYDRIYPGSFNPPHEAHEKLGQNCIWEIPRISFFGKITSNKDLARRVEEINKLGHPVLITNARTHIEKEKLLKSYVDKKYQFVIGSDAWNKCLLNAEEYFGKNCDSEYIVSPRVCESVKHTNLINYRIVNISRPDISSSEIRNKTALITGITGQDGFYLTKLLLQKGYRVIGAVRRTSQSNTKYIDLFRGTPNFSTVYGDVTDASSINRIVDDFKPSEMYCLASNSFVGDSWNAPSHYIETNTIGVVNCLEAARQYNKDCKIYVAGSSEMAGDIIKRSDGPIVINEETPMVAASPYGVSKVAAWQMSKVYRESYDMFVVCSVLCNHSSEIRGKEFFTRKITSQLARVKFGLQDYVEVGNMSACRDEGYSLDYMDAVYRMLQQSKPEDFVIATGETHSCKEWAELTCNYFDLDYNKVIKINPKLFRPNEIRVLIGDSSKAMNILGWKPTVSYQQLNQKMCKYDENLISNPNMAEQFIL